MKAGYETPEQALYVLKLAINNGTGFSITQEEYDEAEKIILSIGKKVEKLPPKVEKPKFQSKPNILDFPSPQSGSPSLPKDTFGGKDFDLPTSGQAIVQRLLKGEMTKDEAFAQLEELKKKLETD